MVLGIISIVIGAIIFITTLIMDIQQIVQYLGFIWASMFVIGGFILITIYKCSNKNTGKIVTSAVTQSVEEKKEEIDLNPNEIRKKVISEIRQK
jgi:hypothetical protein